jgi:hypothetical protein
MYHSLLLYLPKIGVFHKFFNLRVKSDKGSALPTGPGPALSIDRGRGRQV